ncbi:MAG: DNA mismatch repair endonuclease MutL [Clostridia bacterium]|nr:DNA mismatch repair endonuclease MutL [Clostridia bacterium]
MGNIVLLDELTINKIAAGEVVERPASVIKEMVENSIDAGATNINIEIKNGGISYIRITDNGKGIEKDDMEIAFERHATSKIRSAEDLKEVKSMGFRGEALASIAAISNVEMISRTKAEEIGNRIVVEAGRVLSFGEAGCQVGTTITVQNLFFNTPVRYKFLKKDYTESGYIEDAVTRLALIHPDIAFRLINSGKTIIQTSGNGKIQDVIYSIYGKDIASSILEVNYTYEDIHVTGVVGKPEIARSNRSNQIFFVNQRYIKDKTLSGAAENSFKGLLPIGKYGFLVLNIDMDPSMVDVNVHPAKLEVRFQEENKVFKAIYHAIKDTLLKAELIENTEKTIDEIENNKPKSSITDLFRKIKAQEVEPKENMIEQIYNNREETKVVKEEPEFEKLTQEETISNQDKKMDVFKELIAMQQRLKEEAESDPKLHTNIDTLIQNTQKLQDGENSNSEQGLDNKNVDSSEVAVAEDNIENAQESVELKEDTENYETIESGKIENIEPLTSNTETNEAFENIYLEDSINEDIVGENSNQNSYAENEDFIENIEEQNTRKFTSEEVQEMMDKLETIENVEESPEFSNMYEKIFGKLPASVEEEKKKEEEKISAYELIKDNNISVFENIPEYQKPVYKLVGIAFNTYIIIEIKNELYMIDQHAAHERVMYEKVKKNYYSGLDKNSQMLLLPDVITLTHKEMDILKDNVEMFEKAGFVFEEFGDNTIKLTGVPDICLEIDTKELFLETLDEINQVARTAKQEIEERFIATVACKAAVKANMDLTNEEVDSLMEELLKLPNPFTCPHGRPTAIKMDKNDMEKKFARRK